MRGASRWCALVALVIATGLAGPAPAAAGTRTTMTDPCGVGGLAAVDPGSTSAEPVVVDALDLCAAWVATRALPDDGAAVLEVGFDLAGAPARPASGQVHTYRMAWRHAGCDVVVDVQRPGNAIASDRALVQRTCERPDCTPGGDLKLICSSTRGAVVDLGSAQLTISGTRISVTFPASADGFGIDYTAGTVLERLRASTLQGTFVTGHLGVTVATDVTQSGGDHVVGG